jgi:hypothetical protein
MFLNLPPDVWAMLIGAGVLFLSPVAVVYLISNQLR